MPSFAFLYAREKIVGSRSDKALSLAREWTVDPGYRWRPSAKEWEAILARQGDSLVAQYTAGQPAAIDITTTEGKKRLLEFWLTTPEEEYQVVPKAEGEAMVAYLLALRKAEFPLPEAKE